MTARRRGWRIWGAVFAAYLLVIQATLTAVTFGAQAAGPQRGLFDEVICATSPAGAPGQAKHTGLPNCCVLGCAMFGVGGAPGPETAAVAPPQAITVALRRPPSFDAVATTQPRSAFRTRAPPQAA